MRAQLPWCGLLGLLGLAVLAPAAPSTGPVRADGSEPATVVETSNYHSTSRHADVAQFCRSLATQSPRVHLASLGTSHEGRDLPLLILADPPVTTPAAAAQSGKLVVFLFGNIHAGEVSGKEALQLLARDLTQPEADPLFERLIILINPILNADGNERIAATNRTWQGGPATGVGIRANAQNLDLNRDFIKLASPEIQALVRLLGTWDPKVIVDCHDPDGSFHRYQLTYDGPRHPAADPGLIALGGGRFLPEITRRLEAQDQVRTFVYGDFNRDYTRWETYPALPRYGIQYFALRQRLGLLAEAYTYTPFAERVRATRCFLRQVLELSAQEASTIQTAVQEADRQQRMRPLALRHETGPRPERVDVLGWVEEMRDGRRAPTDQPRDYPVTVVDRCTPTLRAHLPQAYLVPAHLTRVLENLRAHGIQYAPLKEPERRSVETYTVTKLTRAGNPFQGVWLNKVEAVTLKTEVEFVVPVGMIRVPMDQPLAVLAAYLLEPQADDSLAAWDFLDEMLAEGQPFPILRQVLLP
ncbi:MAG TPA: M14 family metallopeptidase [Gemmatales bacterium]|nr:M14 family metallopeptidase [Gemmatales bacterium]